jgi:CheY-like chemotaxis protein
MTQQLAGKRILIAEDEVLIAMGIADKVTDRGGKVIGPVASVERALELIASEVIDGAILNVNLQDSDSYPIADALIRRHIPFVFATGYSELPPRFAHVRHFKKPALGGDIFDALEGEISHT